MKIWKGSTGSNGGKSDIFVETTVKFMIEDNLTNYIYKTVFKINLLIIYRFIWFKKKLF